MAKLTWKPMRNSWLITIDSKMKLIIPATAILYFFASSFIWADKKQADLLVYNGTICTVDSLFSSVEAMVISKGRIVAVGNSADLQKQYNAKEKLNAQGRFIYPGFIDAHAHFYSYGLGLQN